MTQKLGNCRVAILVTDDFEQVELTSPMEALEELGAKTIIVSEKPGKIVGMNHDVKAHSFDVGRVFEDVDPANFDAVLLPGGVINADKIRMNQAAREFVRKIDKAGKPIAVICHGSWLLVSAGLVKGRRLTSWPSLQDDLRNAGAQWVDDQVVVDRNWVSSRKPDDLPAFNAKFVEMLLRIEDAS